MDSVLGIKNSRISSIDDKSLVIFKDNNLQKLFTFYIVSFRYYLGSTRPLNKEVHVIYSI